MKRKFKAGLTSVMLPVFILDTTSTTGGGLSGVTHASSGLVLEYRRAGQSSWTSVTPVTKTLGTYVSGGIVADGSLSGAYEVDFPDAAFAAGVRFVVCRVRGVANMLPVLIEIELDAVDYQTDAFGALKPTVAGRTLDVSSGGEAGIDFANIGSPTTTVNLSGTTVATVTTTTTATNVTTVNGLAANVITATSINTGAITAAKFAASAIDATAIASNAITSAKIATDAIGASQIAANAITSSKIATDAITSTQLASSAVTEIAAAVEVQLGLSGSDLDTTLNTMQGLLVGIDGNVTTLLGRITSTLFSGITSLGDWIRRIARKDAGTAGMIAAEAEIDTGGTSTFTGTTDSLEAIRDAGGGGGGGGDPWTTDVSTGYTYPEAGAVLKTVYEKAALITASNVQFSSMVNTDGYIDGDIIIGDDYLAANGRAFQWTFTPNSGFVAATSSCKFGGSNASGTSTWLVTGTVTDNGNGTWTISFDLPLATTSTLLEGLHDWSVECISATNVEITKKRSGKKVKVVRKWTN
jgi:hypothetical protein